MLERDMPQVSRRNWTLGAAGLLLGCRRERKPSSYGYAGFAFVANSEGKAVAAVDLNAFAVVRHIPLDANPIQIVNDPSRPYVYAVTPSSGEIAAISVDKLEVARKVRLGAQPAFAKITPDGRYLWALCPKARQLVRIPAADLRQPDLRIQLPAEPADFALGPEEDRARGRVAVSAADQALLYDTATGKQVAAFALAGGDAGGLLFRKDGRLLLVADRGAHQLTIFDLASGRPACSLPLAVRPDRLCSKTDGGQVFINGEGMDAVVTVYPFQTEVANTMLAGRSPGAMAVSAAWDYLLVANPASDNVTIVSITNQRVLAVAPVGKRPEFIAVTPDGNYALVLNRESGDMAVLHLVIEPRRSRAAAIAARIPVGSGPVAAVVRSL
jgi:DNA-binding beta-propeller fold protein YncE